MRKNHQSNPTLSPTPRHVISRGYQAIRGGGQVGGTAPGQTWSLPA